MERRVVLIWLIIIVLIIIGGILLGMFLPNAPITEYGNCDQIKAEERASFCYLSLALETNDASICNKTPELKDFCDILVNKDESLCLEELGEEDREVCYALINRDITACDQMSDNKKAECHFLIAIAERNPDLCGKITEGDYMCYIYATMVSRDPKNCERIADITGIEEDIKETLKESCYNSMAIINNDPSLCDRLTHTGSRNECLKYFKNL